MRGQVQGGDGGRHTSTSSDSLREQTIINCRKLLCNDDSGFLLGVIAKDLALTVCGGKLGENELLISAAGTLKNC